MTMKYWKFLSVILAVLAVLAISVPAAAISPVLVQHDYIITSGIEIFPGVDFSGDNYGATFVAQTTGNGALRASINYHGTGPTPPSNDIFGGNWTLTILERGKSVGTIIGRVEGGEVVWSPKGKTDLGTVDLDLCIVGGTGKFLGKRGYGFFSGRDNHVTNIVIGSTVVATVDGTLTLFY
jgi:hypothetical protein